MSDVSPPTVSVPVTQAVLEAVLKAELERFATKADLEALRADMFDRFVTKADLKAELERFATKADLDALRAELKAEIAELRAAIAAMPTTAQMEAAFRAINRELLAANDEEHRSRFRALNDVDRTLEGRVQTTEGSLTDLQAVVEAHRTNTAIHVRPRKPRPKRRARR